jgi:hypothetical protein
LAEISALKEENEKLKEKLKWAFIL